MDFLPRILCMQPCKPKVEPAKETHDDVEAEPPAPLAAEETLDNVKFAPNSELGKLYAELRFISDRMREEDFVAECEDNWKYVATVFDR